MRNLRFVIWMFSVGLMVLGAGVVSGQDYPNKPIRILTGEPGGIGDSVGRLIAQALTVSLGQQVIVENRPSGNILGGTAARATPDGYSLLFIGSSFWLGPLLQEAPYDPIKQFEPITMTNNSPHLLVVHPSVQAKSVKELITLAKAKPGALNYSMTGLGGAINLASELFKSMAGVNIVGINYKATAQAVNDLIGGQVQLMFPAVGVAMPHVQSGKVRALAVTSAQPSALAPGLPTVASAGGLPGYEMGNKNGMFAPAKTPVVIINRLNQEMARWLARPEVSEKFLSMGVEAVSTSPAQFAATMKSDITKASKVIKDAGIKTELRQ